MIENYREDPFPADSRAYKGLSFILERQHFIRTTRMHCYRASFQRSREHAERLLEAPLPAGRPSH